MIFLWVTYMVMLIKILMWTIKAQTFPLAKGAWKFIFIGFAIYKKKKDVYNQL